MVGWWVGGIIRPNLARGVLTLYRVLEPLGPYIVGTWKVRVGRRARFRPGMKITKRCRYGARLRSPLFEE